jgi:pilus assembly protein CpaB
MKILKNKTIIGILAILLGISICFVLTPVYNKSLENKVKIVQVIKTIPKGSLISAEDVKEIEVGSYNLPENVNKGINSVIGMYATTDLFKEDFLLPEKLSSTPLSNNEYLENLEDPFGAMSITLQSFAAGLSGKLLKGDVVSIIATNNNDNSTIIPPELKYIKVLASTTSEGADVDPGTIKKEADNNENVPTTVTLEVNEQQAKSLANLEATQKVHIALIYRGEEEICTQYLDKQKEILGQLKTIEEAAEIIEPVNSEDITEQEEANDD